MARLKEINTLKLRDLFLNFKEYAGLSEGLVKLVLPDKLKIGKKYYSMPADIDEFSKNICYGQRIFFIREEDNDIGVILRLIAGYYYTIVTGEKWDEAKALLFGKVVLDCTLIQLYPVAMHLNNLINQVIEREKNLLYREPSKLEIAAGIERLNIFSDLSALDYLRDSMKITIEEVLLTPYNECLVRFMQAKELSDFQTRYFELMKDVNEPKHHAATR